MTRVDFANLGSSSDRAHARTGYAVLLNRAHTGRPLPDLFTDKALHEVHEFKPFGTDEVATIWRLRSGPLRIYFVYGPAKNIVVIHTEAKRSKKLTRGEKIALENLARPILQIRSSTAFEVQII